MKETKQNKLRKRILTAAAAVLAAAVLACVFYIGNYYHAEEPALEAIAHPAQDITVSEEEDRIIFTPENPRAGLIFYPGGKVQYESYAPLMEACAEQGLLCVLLQMPGNLAVLDVNAAEGIPEEYPAIESWYMGGHSLGGSMAASYLSSHPDDFEGLILLAAYSTEDLKDSGLSVLSVYGSEDGVMNRDSYEAQRKSSCGFYGIHHPRRLPCLLRMLWSAEGRRRAGDYERRTDSAYSGGCRKIHKRKEFMK